MPLHESTHDKVIGSVLKNGNCIPLLFHLHVKSLLIPTARLHAYSAHNIPARNGKYRQISNKTNTKLYFVNTQPNIKYDSNMATQPKSYKKAISHQETTQIYQ